MLVMRMIIINQNAKRRIVLFVAAVFAASASPLHAGEIAFGPGLEAQGWKPLTFRSLKPMSFVPEGRGQLNISGEKAVSVIWRTVDEAWWTYRAARWRWRVSNGPPASNLAIKGGDDRAIALHFVFAKDDEAARAAKGSGNLMSAMWWSSGSTLIYVWGGEGVRNAVVASPHLGASGKLILRQPGMVADGAWRAERADLAADFRRAFGREPGPLVGIAVASDNDDSGTRTIAAIAGLLLE